MGLYVRRSFNGRVQRFAARYRAVYAADTGCVKYKLMNDYSAAWPFWGGRDIGLCHDDDPALPAEVAAAARSWAAQFNELFDHEYGWPNRAIALAHREEGERLFAEVGRLLPDHDVSFHYWEHAYRDVR